MSELLHLPWDRQKLPCASEDRPSLATAIWKAKMLFLLTSSKKKRNLQKTGSVSEHNLLLWRKSNNVLCALSPQIVFLLSMYLQRNIRLPCLYFSGLHNARLEAGRWTNLTPGITWQMLLWFNCCLGGFGGWVWHNNISKNNGHLVYIESFFLWFQSKFQA